MELHVPVPHGFAEEHPQETSTSQMLRDQKVNEKTTTALHLKIRLFILKLIP